MRILTSQLSSLSLAFWSCSKTEVKNWPFVKGPFLAAKVDRAVGIPGLSLGHSLQMVLTLAATPRTSKVSLVTQVNISLARSI